MEVAWEAMGSTACVSAVFLLRTAWQKKGAARRWRLSAAALMLMAAVAFFAVVCGPVIASVAASLVFSLLAILVVRLGAERTSRKGGRHAVAVQRVAEREPVRGKRRRGWAKGVAAVFLTTITANAVAAALAGIAPGTPLDRFSAAALSVPLLWAGLLIWLLSARQVLRPVLGMAGASALAGATITWVMLA